MTRCNRTISCFLILAASISVSAQPNKFGVPIITNYEHFITGGSEQNWCITQDQRGILYFGNNDRGVLEYDGVEWRSIPVLNNSIVRSLASGDNGVVYVGAESEFGYLAPDGNGSMHYRSLTDTLDQDARGWDIGRVWRTYVVNEKVYFCTFPTIYVYDPVRRELTSMELPDYAFFSFFIDEELYMGDYGRGLMHFEQDSFTTVTGGEFFKEFNISGLVKYDEQRLLVGSYERGLYLLDLTTGEVDDSFVEPGLQEYFMNGVITHMLALNGDFVVATQFAGLVILDSQGHAREIITEDEGLIDQTIPYVYADDSKPGSGPLWIANFRGISKLEADSPFRRFTEESGLDGFITDIKVFNGMLVVSTFGGLYYKESTSAGTFFRAIPEIQDHIENLFILKPSPGIELLLASTSSETYVLDGNLNISTIHERLVNPPGRIEEMVDYGGKQIIGDPDQPDVIYTGRMSIIGMQYVGGRWKEVLRYRDVPEDLLSLGMDKYGYLWTSYLNAGISQLSMLPSGAGVMKYMSSEDGLPTSERNLIFIDPDTEEVLIGTANGFFRYNYFRDSLYRDTIYNRILPEGKNRIMAFHRDTDGDYWFSFENEHSGWTELMAVRRNNALEILVEKPFQRLQNVSVDVIFSDPERGIWFGKSSELYHFDKSYERTDTVIFRTIIRNVTIGGDSVLFNGTYFRENDRGGFTIHPFQWEGARPLIRYRYNNIEFRWAAPFFEQEDKMEYSYWLEGFENGWSAWTGADYKDFTNLPFGSYVIHVKARNVYGDESIADSYSFTIMRPWYATIPAIIAYLFLSALVVYLIIKLYTRRLKQENIRLEGIIQERTAEIRKQKEELTDSIEYASRIQRALLPQDRLMEENNIEHFILFRPRDIVSGDFYWMGSRDHKLFVVAADCTGHGVPGAFMSMLGMTFLDEIVIKSEITDTGKILDQLRQHVITSLKQSGKSMEESTKDGMDLSMVALDMERRQIQYSGAYNPLYLVRELNREEKQVLDEGNELDLPRGSIHDHQNILIQVKADQMPIGISEKTLPFTSEIFQDEGYTIYMFSDGFLDQFGGPQGKKFMSRNFKKLILELQPVPLKDQGAAMEKILLGWMGGISQIDDILVMGIRMDGNDR